MPGAEAAHEPETESSIMKLPLINKSDYFIEQKQVDEWENLYQAVDIVQELRKMKGWLDSNPKRRKTKNGILRFITNWLAREQDKGGIYRHQDQKTRPSGSNNQFLRILDSGVFDEQ